MASLPSTALAFLVGGLAGAGGVLLFTTDVFEGDEQTQATIVAQATKGGPVSEEAARILARKFRPVLRFDSREPWRPLDIERFFEEGEPGKATHRICTTTADAKDDCEDVDSLADVTRLGSGASSLGSGRYLDLIGQKADGKDATAPGLAGCESRAPRDCNSGSGSAIYYNVTAANRRFYVDYWWFYRFNDFDRLRPFTSCKRRFLTECGDHEGDWEGATVVTTDRPPYRLQYVAYASHTGVFRYPRGQLKLADERPYVYVARGSHASYPKPCSGRDCRQQLKTGSFRRPEERYDGEQGWGRNLEADCKEGSCLQPFPRAELAPQASWNAFAGRWGFRCAKVGPSCPVAQGPQSPSRQERYREPWCFSLRKAKSCDVPTPRTKPEATAGHPTETDCDAWLGQLTAALACDRRRIAVALGPSTQELAERLTLRVGGLTGDDGATPGVAQLLRAALEPRETVTITGSASTETTLTVRAATRKAVAEARFRGLVLRRGERAVVSVGERDGLPTVQLRRPDGSVERPRDLNLRRL